MANSKEQVSKAILTLENREVVYDDAEGDENATGNVSVWYDLVLTTSDGRKSIEARVKYDGEVEVC